MIYRKVDPVCLQRLIEESGVPFKANRKSFIFACPRCQKRDKLMMFRSDGRFICWVCAESSGFKGRPELALVELLGLPLKLIREKIYGDSFEQTPSGYLDLQLRDFFEDDPPADLQALVRGKAWPLDFYPIDHKHATKGREYLESRGIGPELAQAYGLRYCPVQKRVIFPIQVGPKLRGWQARAIFPTDWEDEEGNRMSSPKILTTGSRDSVLMFQDRLAGCDHAIVCEGPVDAIKCHLAGGNVATMGKVVSREQVEIVKRSGVTKVYLALDPDAAVETQRLVTQFNGVLDMYRLLPAPGFEDLGAMSPEAVLNQFLAAPKVSGGEVFLHFDA